MKDIIIVHDFDGRPYFKAIEKNFQCKFINSRPIRFLIRDIVKREQLLKTLLILFCFYFFCLFIKTKL
ncbi:hypothetical protein BvCmsSINP020_1834 [Escherichia coli]|nr:hypothetical protein BvCmsSINP020_1834 [Escherichia coli]